MKPGVCYPSLLGSVDDVFSMNSSGSYKCNLDVLKPPGIVGNTGNKEFRTQVLLYQPSDL